MLNMIMQHDKYMVLRLRNIIAWVNKIVMNIMTRNKQICRQIHCVGALSKQFGEKKFQIHVFCKVIKRLKKNCFLRKSLLLII